jgi:DNA primase
VYLHYVFSAPPPLYVFEGYGDAATAYDKGLHGCCAIGSTAFTEEHLDLILDAGISHVICNLDADDAGHQGMEKFVKIVETRAPLGFKAELLELPKGSDDPDAYLRSGKTLDDFLNEPRTDIFTWQLKACIAAGVHKDKVFDDTVGLIAKEPAQLEAAAYGRGRHRGNRDPV